MENRKDGEIKRQADGIKDTRRDGRRTRQIEEANVKDSSADGGGGE